VLSLTRPNFLILDEPTNHLDIDGKEQLELQLLESGAAMLVTAHDRRFLDTIAERYLWIHNDVLTEIADPVEFYRSPEARRNEDVGRPPRDASIVDDALSLIVELETKLDQDRARKPKFQKHALQQEWQTQLEELYRRIEDD
jgi:ATP-binding cassette subfamily F protein 3